MASLKNSVARVADPRILCLSSSTTTAGAAAPTLTTGRPNADGVAVTPASGTRLSYEEFSLMVASPLSSAYYATASSAGMSLTRLQRLARARGADPPVGVFTFPARVRLPAPSSRSLASRSRPACALLVDVVERARLDRPRGWCRRCWSSPRLGDPRPARPPSSSPHPPSAALTRNVASQPPQAKLPLSTSTLLIPRPASRRLLLHLSCPLGRGRVASSGHGRLCSPGPGTQAVQDGA